VVVGRPRQVRYSTIGFSVDEVELAVTCFGPMDGDEAVDLLAGIVRDAVRADQSVGGTVAAAYPFEQINWRAINIGGADFLATDVILAIQQ
jgi:hypothetical protein